MVKQNKLLKLSYYDSKAEVRLECYADTVVIDKEGFIIAIRFGGYPESVKGMADAIYGGGSVTIEINGESKTIQSRSKQYRREYSHDGIYAEATLLIRDEEQRTDSDEENDGNTDNANKPRRAYLFCEQNNSDRLFEELDKATSVPLIPEFKDYILSELQDRGILKQLQVISYREKFDVFLLSMSKDEQNIIDVVNDGLRTGAISIPGAINNDFPAVYSVTQYLNQFGVQIAERIKSQFNPLFDPATETLSPEILAVNNYIKKTAGYSLYDAQLAVAEAHKRCLVQQKATLCIAECGVGKSKIGITALHAYQQKNRTTHEKHFNIILGPAHVAKKWVREIEESLPNTFAIIVNSITEINKVYEAYNRDNKSCYIIITKERARDGYMTRPVATWNQRRKAFLCSDCYEPLMMDLIDCGSKYKVQADGFFFRRKNKQNLKCTHCGTPLWTALVPEQQSEWVKVSDYGFVHRSSAHAYLNVVEKKPAIYEAVKAIVDNPDGHFPNAGAYRRFPLSTYIKRKMKGKVDGLIVDELHNYNNNSGQGDAMGELNQAAKKTVGMTATLINGYSSGIFHLLYRISSALMLKDGKSYDKPTVFDDEYGVTESVYEIMEADYNSNRRTAKRKLRSRQLPGVSPLVYSRFLMDSAAFLSLNDMGKDLPEYEEIPVPLHMNEDVAREYHRIEGQFIEILRTRKDIAQKILSSYLGLLTVYPDQPYNHKPVVHPIFGNDLVVPRDTSSFNELHEKDESVLDVVRRKVAEGGRVLVYTSWTRIDTQEKLSKLLTEEGFRVAILTAAVSASKREAWVEKQVKSGIDVLITNASLIETGLCLNDFTTLYYYNVSYNLFTLRQSSRRSWRINQCAPRVEVYFSYYDGTMQHRAIRLMASKLSVAQIIEGSNFTDEGLASMSHVSDLTSALARELTSGIKNEVEDLSEIFRKMAILKPDMPEVEPDTGIIGEAVDVAITPVLDFDIVSAPSPEKRIRPAASGLLSLLHQPKPVKPSKKKATYIDPNQMTLFDLIEKAS